MNTKILMTASALVLALLGIGTLFAPQELLTYLALAFGAVVFG